MTHMQTEKENLSAIDEIDLRDLFTSIWKGRWLITVVTVIFTVFAIFYALNLPDVYKSEVTLAPAEESGLKMPSQLGGLAALAGVNLGNSGSNKTTMALEVIQSRNFIGRFIAENELLIPLMAAKGWDRAKNEIYIDEKVFNTQSKKWVRDVASPYEKEPSLQEAIIVFKSLITIKKDDATGIVVLAVEHYSPYIAKDIVDKITFAINDEMRKRDLAEAERSIDYLNSKIIETNLADVRAMLFSLIEEQTKNLMLANVRNEYVFKTIDPAIVPELKSKPGRSLIVAVGFFAGLMLSILIVVLLSFKNNQNLK